MERDVPGRVGGVGNAEASAAVWEDTVISGDGRQTLLKGAGVEDSRTLTCQLVVAEHQLSDV